MPRPSKIMRKMKGMVKSRKLQTRAPEIGGCGSLIKDIVTGLTGAVLEYAVKKYKSHRGLSPPISLHTIEEDFIKKKKSQMTFKRFK